MIDATPPIYLTFDDGPDPQWTPRILDLLSAADARATFFVIGEFVRRRPELARRIVREGHALGNHTYSHKHPWAIMSRTARAEVRNGAGAVCDAVGTAPAYFRPPHGRRRASMIQEARRLGEGIVMWDVSAIDWGPLGSADRIARRLSRLKPRDIVLMHDGRNRRNRPDELMHVLPVFLGSLRERGLRPELLPNQAKVCDM
ncbi:MAG TPA: polysaccharide deacetylase family protein [Steroidobacter sp.]|jgi:peptidoglycan/xylan/chitin deacetylase (PgdA/CDA1 family)|nr:polysaccharide deacetylase family protein [Steroidobacter sp.]